ncbi:hypothetical protein GCM10023224_44240 [Streptomonospora halophila]|uniref:Uncharacterized protein n=1 Tax=Streptomonospora halophila TaxID=427369 RepID=A0ABP9GVU3_9ACTN
MKYHIAMALSFTAAGGLAASGTPESFDAFVDRVADELFDLEAAMGNVHDPGVAGRLTDRRMSITLVIEARTPEDGAPFFLTTVRTALHAAGAGTGNRPAFEPAQAPAAGGVELTAA